MRSMKFQALLVAFTVLLGSTALAGSVTGTVKYDGKVPNLRPVKMDADPGCAKKHSAPMQSEVLVLGDGNTMGNVFVRVKSGLAGKDYPTPKEAVVLDQDGCRYKPHVLGVMVGQPMRILNSDGLLHNVHALPKVNKTFNMAMPASRTDTTVTFDKEEFMFKIKCDVHPWMGAYISVMTHPFFAVTAEDGKFKIDNLPPGTYEIEAWHEKLKTMTSTVTISGDETQTADFSFSPPSR
jgi:plastocyanin